MKVSDQKLDEEKNISSQIFSNIEDVQPGNYASEENSWARYEISSASQQDLVSL